MKTRPRRNRDMLNLLLAGVPIETVAQQFGLVPNSVRNATGWCAWRVAARIAASQQRVSDAADSGHRAIGLDTETAIRD